MLKFSILVLAGLYSQASGLYFGQYDVLVRAVDDVGDRKTKNDTSGLIPAISTALIGNGTKSVPNPAELASNFTGTTDVKAPALHAAEAVKDAAAALGKVVETAGKDTASAALGKVVETTGKDTASAALGKVVETAGKDTASAALGKVIETTGKDTASAALGKVVETAGKDTASAALGKVVETTGKDTASATEIKAAPAETAAAKTENATEISENEDRAEAGTDKPEATPTPPKSRRNAKVRTGRKSRQSRSLGAFDYDYGHHIQIQVPTNTGIVGPEDPLWPPGDPHIPTKTTRRYWDWRD